MINKLVETFFEEPEKIFKWFLSVWIVWVSFLLVCVIGIVITAIHFITKYW